MDPLEKKIGELYWEKRKEDEKSMPPFDAFRDKQEEAEVFKQPIPLLRIAASVAAMTIGVVVLWYYLRNTGKPAAEVRKINPVNIKQSLPSESLLSQNFGITYIWQWKSPTDNLLEDANKLTQTGINKKL